MGNTPFHFLYDHYTTPNRENQQLCENLSPSALPAAGRFVLGDPSLRSG
jgi:hypothetical protein